MSIDSTLALVGTEIHILWLNKEYLMSNLILAYQGHLMMRKSKKKTTIKTPNPKLHTFTINKVNKINFISHFFLI